MADILFFFLKGSGVMQYIPIVVTIPPWLNLIYTMTIFNFVAPYISETKRTALSKFEEFVMVLMKLRLNLYDQDLAYRFRVHQSTVSRKTRRWIEAMFVRLQPLIKWPGIDENHATFLQSTL